MINGPSTLSALPPPLSPARTKQLRDLTMDALALFKRKKFNPLEELVNCYQEIDELDASLNNSKETEVRIQCKRLKFDVIKEIVQYGTPKLRSVEHTGEINTGLTVILGVAPKNVTTLEMQDTDHRLPAATAKDLGDE
jgi:hypothetical protein